MAYIYNPGKKKHHHTLTLTEEEAAAVLWRYEQRVFTDEAEARALAHVALRDVVWRAKLLRQHAHIYFLS